MGLPELQAGPVAAEEPETRRILDIARSEFVRHGFRRTDIADICAKAGVSRPTVYRRCGNKDDIVKTVTQREAASAFAAIAESVASFESSRDRVIEAYVAGVREWRTNELVGAIRQYEPEMLIELMTDPDMLGPVQDLVADLLAAVADSHEAARRAAVVFLRITVSLLVVPTPVLPLDSDEAARSFAQTSVDAFSAVSHR